MVLAALFTTSMAGSIAAFVGLVAAAHRGE